MADPKSFFWIVASVADTGAFNPKATKMLDVKTFFVNSKPAVINGLIKLRNPLLNFSNTSFQ